jgi:hypothetical protein
LYVLLKQRAAFGPPDFTPLKCTGLNPPGERPKDCLQGLLRLLQPHGTIQLQVYHSPFQPDHRATVHLPASMAASATRLCYVLNVEKAKHTRGECASGLSIWSEHPRLSHGWDSTAIDSICDTGILLTQIGHSRRRRSWPLTSRRKAGTEVQKWEYKKVGAEREWKRVRAKWTEWEYEFDLDELGLEGWELVSAYPVAGYYGEFLNGATTRIVYVFKRPIQSPIEER